MTSIVRKPLDRLLAAVICLLVVAAIGVVDYATGVWLSFAVLYVLVVVVFTVAAEPLIGVVGALVSAVVWGVADALTQRLARAAWVDVANGILRFAVLSLVVWLVTALLRALEAARQAEARSRAFLSVAAHQLRTPVAALGTSVEVLLLQLQGASPEQEALLAHVAGETSRLGRLVGSLLRAARLDQGVPLQPEPVDLVALCEWECERVRHPSTLECACSVDPGFPEEVMLDRDATREALANLLDNARRHARHRIRVRLGVAHGHVVVDVTDDGPGLPTGSEPAAFERFVTLDGRGGSGLGLPIARELCRQQGGDLRYADKTFTITLPVGQCRPSSVSSTAGSRSP